MFVNQFVFLVFFAIVDKCLLEKNKTVVYEDFYPRVVNGWPAKLGDVPYQVGFKALSSRTRQTYMTFCGGTIVAPNKVLSAAHCFVPDMSMCVRIFVKVGRIDQQKLFNKYAVAGTLKNSGQRPTTDNTDEGQWRALKEAIYPKTYNFPKDDIALVFLLEDFIYNSNVGPIPYAKQYADYKGKCLVSGYGQIVSVGKAKSEKLLLAHLEIVPRSVCNRKHFRNMRHFVCTSSVVTDVGKGDSGGPLVCNGTGDPNEKGAGVLVGIVSGHRLRVGSFFTRVSSFYNYIERNKSYSIQKSLSHFVHAIIILAQSLSL
ncbi:chymotrypsin-1-like [Papilio machaon]|uniref:chymotrypsin-1-like n=1 Tax=Papilio machaon TaxID=76193 RepID=UPI001E665D50|nr:chymotrypsin-1-like [Papilio machaon]